MTFREFICGFDARVLHDWDQACLVASEIHNLGSRILSSFAGKQLPYKMSHEFNPYRSNVKKVKGAIREITVLRDIARAYAQGK